MCVTTNEKMSIRGHEHPAQKGCMCSSDRGQQRTESTTNTKRQRTFFRARTPKCPPTKKCPLSFGVCGLFCPLTCSITNTQTHTCIVHELRTACLSTCSEGFYKSFTCAIVHAEYGYISMMTRQCNIAAQTINLQ